MPIEPLMLKTLQGSSELGGTWFICFGIVKCTEDPGQIQSVVPGSLGISKLLYLPDS